MKKLKTIKIPRSEKIESDRGGAYWIYTTELIKIDIEKHMKAYLIDTVEQAISTLREGKTIWAHDQLEDLLHELKSKKSRLHISRSYDTNYKSFSFDSPKTQKLLPTKLSTTHYRIMQKESKPKKGINNNDE